MPVDRQSPELGEVRRSRILSMAGQQGSVRVSDLSARFGVTPETIRREINRLVRQGRLTRVHGGAVLPPTSAQHEVPFHARAGRQYVEKGEIASAAALLVEEGDVIALDASTTALTLALELRSRHMRSLVVLTNGAQLPVRICDAEGMTIVCTGGTLRSRSLSYVGPQTLRAIEGYRVRKAFFSCRGFTVQDGPTEGNEADAEVKQAFIRAADAVILLVDHSKWGRNSLVPICPLSNVAHIVTDRAPPAEERAALAAMGIAVHAPPEGRDAGDGEPCRCPSRGADVADCGPPSRPATPAALHWSGT